MPTQTVPDQLVCRVALNQVLVIFIIHNRSNPLKSRAHPLLAATLLVIVAVAVLLPLTPIGSHFGFVPARQVLPHPRGDGSFIYLSAVELAKRVFYRWATVRKWP